MNKKSNNRFSLFVSNILQKELDFKMDFLAMSIDGGQFKDSDALHKAKYRLKDYKQAKELIRKMTDSRKE